MIDSNIFNTNKSDYGRGESVFLGQSPGLVDTVHRPFPELFKLYKTMKSLDWDELEFDFKTCNVEFKTRPSAIAQRMIRTLAWQWEADSVASRSILPVFAPFISAPELQFAWTRITDNENIHALTYSEIVKFSFDDPNTVLKEVLEVKEAMQRLKVVANAFGHVYKVSHEYALGHRENNQETYNAAYLGTVALLILERIQFMSSFAVTFAIGETGAFMPIAKAVQKICQDEFEVHVAVDKEILRIENQNSRGKQARQDLNGIITDLVNEVVRCELAWNETLLDGPQLVGLNKKLLNDWVLYSAGDVYETLGIKQTEFKIPKDNPLPFMNNWVDISKTQAAVQEQQNGQYKVGVMERTDENKTFEVDF